MSLKLPMSKTNNKLEFFLYDLDIIKSLKYINNLIYMHALAEVRLIPDTWARTNHADSSLPPPPAISRSSAAPVACSLTETDDMATSCSLMQSRKKPESLFSDSSQVLVFVEQEEDCTQKNLCGLCLSCRINIIFELITE